MGTRAVCQHGNFWVYRKVQSNLRLNKCSCLDRLKGNNSNSNINNLCRICWRMVLGVACHSFTCTFHCWMIFSRTSREIVLFCFCFVLGCFAFLFKKKKKKLTSLLVSDDIETIGSPKRSYWCHVLSGASVILEMCEFSLIKYN